MREWREKNERKKKVSTDFGSIRAKSYRENIWRISRWTVFVRFLHRSCLLRLSFLSFLSFCFDSKKKEMEGKERESTATDAYKTIFSTEIRVSTNLTILLYSLMRNMGEKIDWRVLEEASRSKEWNNDDTSPGSRHSSCQFRVGLAPPCKRFEIDARTINAGYTAVGNYDCISLFFLFSLSFFLFFLFFSFCTILLLFVVNRDRERERKREME